MPDSGLSIDNEIVIGSSRCGTPNCCLDEHDGEHQCGYCGRWFEGTDTKEGER